MKKEFVPFETAKKLRAIGFDESCCAFYEEERVVNKPEMVDDQDQYRVSGWRTCKNSEVPGHYFAAATFSQAFRWFREKHKLQHHIWSGKLNHIFYGYDILNIEEQEFVVNNSDIGGGDCDYDTYEEAELACLETLIETVESKAE